MNGQWKLVSAQAPYVEGWAWAGLVIVYAYDAADGFLHTDRFEILHQASGEIMLEVAGNLERAREIATDLASIADWSGMSTTDEPMLQAKIMAFGAGYPGEVSVFNEWAMPDDLERIVPFG